MFKFENVSFKRDKKLILDNINWEVNEGEKWAVLGLNGSGKTTLLKLLNGYIWPSTGTLTVLGEVFGKTSLPELRKSIGYVSSALQQELRDYETAEVIVLSGKFASIGVHEITTEQDEKRAVKMLIDCGGEHLLGKEYSILSQGERQIVLIARALMANPKLLILDEPCTGLDIFAKQNLLEKINMIAKMENAPTMLYVTHHTEEILPCFTKTLLLRKGKVFASGETKDIINPHTLSDFYDKPVQVVSRENGQLTVFPIGSFF